MFYFQVLSHKVIVSVHAQSPTSPQRFLSPLLPPSPFCFSLSCLWHLHVKRQQKSCFNLYPWLIVCAERMVVPFPPFTFSNPLFSISSQHWLHLNNESNWTWLNITIHSQSISPNIKDMFSHGWNASSASSDSWTLIQTSLLSDDWQKCHLLGLD